MNLQQRQLLVDLRELLAGLTPAQHGHFNMGYWFDNLRGADIEGGVSVEALEECGTVACAAGWGATLPSWRAAGFELRPDSRSPEFNGDIGYSALGGLLGISHYAAQWIFNPDHYYRDADNAISVERVCDHIDQTLARYEPIEAGA